MLLPGGLHPPSFLWLHIVHFSLEIIQGPSFVLTWLANPVVHETLTSHCSWEDLFKVVLHGSCSQVVLVLFLLLVPFLSCFSVEPLLPVTLTCHVAALGLPSWLGASLRPEPPGSLLVTCTVVFPLSPGRAIPPECPKVPIAWIRALTSTSSPGFS